MNTEYYTQFPYTDSIFKKHINKPIKTIVELGCNRFQYTYDILATYDPTILYAFEACPRTSEFCISNIHDNRIRFVSQAVSDKDGFIDFYIFGHGNEEYTVCGSVFERIHLKEWQEPKVIVPSTRLDTFFRDMPDTVVDLLCMDIQGSELRALQGMGSLLNSLSYVMLEMPKENKFMHKDAPTRADFMSFFDNNGFKMLECIRENDWEDNVLLEKIR